MRCLGPPTTPGLLRQGARSRRSAIQVLVSVGTQGERHASRREATRAGHVQPLKRIAIVFLLPLLIACGTPAPSGEPLSLMTVQGGGSGCATAALLPVRVTRDGGAMVFKSVGSGEDVTVAWPPGFAAVVVDGDAKLFASDGQLIATEGYVLDNLGGSQNQAGSAFVVCSVGEKIYN